MCFHDDVEDQVQGHNSQNSMSAPGQTCPFIFLLPTPWEKYGLKAFWTENSSAPGTQRNGPEGRDRLHGGESLDFMDTLPMGRGEATERPEWGHLNQGTQSRTQHGQV